MLFLLAIIRHMGVYDTFAQSESCFPDVGLELQFQKVNQASQSNVSQPISSEPTNMNQVKNQSANQRKKG